MIERGIKAASDPLGVPSFPYEYRTVEEIRAGIFDDARHVVPITTSLQEAFRQITEPEERRARHGITITG